jgi:hypothetical protein
MAQTGRVRLCEVVTGRRRNNRRTKILTTKSDFMTWGDLMERKE